MSYSQSVAADIKLPLWSFYNTILQIGHHLQHSLGQLPRAFLLINGNIEGITLIIKALNR